MGTSWEELLSFDHLHLVSVRKKKYKSALVRRQTPKLKFLHCKFIFIKYKVEQRTATIMGMTMPPESETVSDYRLVLDVRIASVCALALTCVGLLVQPPAPNAELQYTQAMSSVDGLRTVCAITCLNA